MNSNIIKKKNLVFIDIYEDSIIDSVEYDKFGSIFSLKAHSIERNKKELLRSKPRILWLELKNLLKLSFDRDFLIYKNSKIYINGLHLSTLLYLKLRSKEFNSSQIVIANLYFHKVSLNKYFNIFLKFLFKNKNYSIIVQSPSEVTFFGKLDKELNVTLIPYAMPEIEYDLLDRHNANYFFSGGYTNRDYELLFDAAKLFPAENFIVVASSLNSINSENVPENVKLYFDIPPNEFNEFIINSKCVIIPLKYNVGSSGQMLCQAAMQMSKLIIYSDYDVISQYFLLKDSGIPYCPNDLESLTTSIRNFLKLNDKESLAIGRNAYVNYRNYFCNELRVKHIIDYVMSR